MLSSSEVLVGSYDYFLVGLSVLISIVASYAALDLAGRVTSTGGMRRLSWLGYGAVTMGLGIWSMHYVGMLAFRVPVPVLYDWPTVLLSLLAAILASGVALYVVSREKLGVALVIAGSLLMGGGIASMHYIGMAAMRLPAMCHYSTPIVSLSIALAVVISFVALLLAFRLREDKAAARGRKAISALAMGLAIPVMHYTGMAAATFTPAAVYQGTLTSAVNITTLGAAVLVIVTLSILSLTVLTSSFDRRFSRQATELQISESRSRLILEASLDAFVEINADETISSWNPQAQRTFGWTSAEAMGKSFPDLLLPAGRRGAYESNLGALSDASPGRPVNRRFETRACRRDAGEFPVEITLSSTGSVRSRHFGAFIRDLSQRERTDQKFSGLLNASSEAILFVNSRGEIVLANSQAAKLFGYSVAEMQKERIETLVPDRFREQHGGFQEGFFQHPRARRMGEGLELWGVRQDGSEFPTEISLAPVEAEEGTLACAVIVDITARKEREQALKNTHEKLAAVLAEAEFRAQEGTKLADLLDILQSCHTIEEAFQVVERYLPRILECPSGALALTNSSRNCVEVAARWNQMELSTELTFTPDQCWALRRGKPHSAGGGEPGPRCTHVRASDVSYICAPLAAQGETLGVLYLERISELAAAAPSPLGDQGDVLLNRATALAERLSLALANLRLREVLRHQSIRDPLTGLFNRRYLEQTLERELKRAARNNESVSVLMFDLDHFKRFNDTFGHQAGDALLKAVGQLVINTIRGQDVPCRYGGEEFAIILTGAALDVAARRAEGLRAAVEKLSVQHAGQTLGAVSLSIGVAAFPAHPGDEELIRAADAALYKAKSGGRNRVVVDSALLTPSQEGQLAVAQPSDNLA